jgi:uncharacterized membrane protein
MATVSFANDIQPIFTQFRGQMLWRLDLTSYDQVKANAQLIYNRISSTDNPMPPAPFDPLTQEQIDSFSAWINGGMLP